MKARPSTSISFALSLALCFAACETASAPDAFALDAASDDAAALDAAASDDASLDAAASDGAALDAAASDDASLDALSAIDGAPFFEADAASDVGPDAGPRAEGYDVFLLAGQSNMVGRGTPFDPVLDAVDPNIWQWTQAGAVTPATARLDHNDGEAPERVGMGLSFARAYHAANPSRPVLLVPTAKGGSGFAGEDWNPGDYYFETAVTQANAAMASHPGNRLIAILWHQGENDVLAPYSTAQYAAAVDRLIYRLRARVSGAATAPFILGQFVPAWTSSPSPAAVLSAINATPSRVAFTAVAPSAGLSGNSPEDVIHFDAPSLRTYGSRYFTALASALANAPTVSLASAPRTLSAEPGTNTLALTWLAPSALGGGTLLGYRVEWRAGTGGWSSTFASGPITLNGLLAATAYEVRVYAQNEAGLGPAVTFSVSTL